MPAYIVTYDTKDNDALKMVRERGEFISASAYLILDDGPAESLANEILCSVGKARDQVVDSGASADANAKVVLKDDENLAVLGPNPDWVAYGERVKRSKLAELFLGPAQQTVTLHLENGVLEELKKKAEKTGQTLEEYCAYLLEQQTELRIKC